MLRSRMGIFLSFALSLSVIGQSAELGAPPSDSDIRQILANRIDTEKQSVGIVVGLIDANGRRIVSYGNLEKGDKRPLDGNTVFEIGSITKVFKRITAQARHGFEFRCQSPRRLSGRRTPKRNLRHLL